jgi:hypothetical protein
MRFRKVIFIVKFIRNILRTKYSVFKRQSEWYICYHTTKIGYSKLQKPVCMYNVNWKHLQDFWKTLSTAVSTTMLSLSHLNKEQNGQCSPVLPTICLAFTSLEYCDKYFVLKGILVDSTHLIRWMLCLDKKFPQLLNFARWRHFNMYMKNMLSTSWHFYYEHLKK